MAKDAVGNLSILVSANAVGFDRDVSRVVNETNNLHKRIKPPPAIDFGSLGAGAVSKGGGFAAAAGGLVGVASAGGLVAKTLDTIADKAKLGSAGRAFGLDAQQFTGIAAVAKSVGEDTREFVESLVTMGKVVSDGIAGRGEEAPAFFRAINVEAKEFAGLRADQQFFKVFESLEKVQDPLARVRALMTAFGEDGGKWLLPLLSKSSVELRAMAGQMGTSAAAMRDMEAAQQSVTKATAAMDQAWTKVAAAAAPAVEAAANTLSAAIGKLNPQFESMGSVGETQFGRVALAAAKVADIARGTAALVAGTASIFTEAFGHVIATAGVVAKQVPGYRQGSTERFGDSLIAKSRNLRAAAGDNMSMSLTRQLEESFARADADRASRGAAAALAGQRSPQLSLPPGMAEPAKAGGGSIDPLTERAKKLRESIDLDQRLAESHRALQEMVDRNLLTGGQRLDAERAAWRDYANDALKAIDDPFRRWQETQRLMAEGVKSGAISPFAADRQNRSAFGDHAQRQRDVLEQRGAGAADKFALEADLIRQQAQAGMFASGDERYRALGRLGMGLDGVMDRKEIKLPTAMLKGSQEAESLLSRTIAGGKPKDPGERIALALKALADKQMTEEKLAKAIGMELERRLPRIVPAGN